MSGVRDPEAGIPVNLCAFPDILSKWEFPGQRSPWRAGGPLFSLWEHLPPDPRILQGEGGHWNLTHLGVPTFDQKNPRVGSCPFPEDVGSGVLCTQGNFMVPWTHTSPEIGPQSQLPDFPRPHLSDRIIRPLLSADPPTCNLPPPYLLDPLKRLCLYSLHSCPILDLYCLSSPRV